MMDYKVGFFFIFYLLSLSLVAQPLDFDQDKKTLPSFRADCIASFSQTDVNINNVRARLRGGGDIWWDGSCLLYTSPSPRDVEESRMPSSA